MSDRTLSTTQPIESGLVVRTAGRLQEHPAAVYLASLAKSGQRTQRIALEQVAYLLISVRDVLSVDWAALRYQHLAAIRTRLIESGYAASSINRTLVAVRMVLKHAWLLGLMSAEDYQRAAQVERVTGEREPAGRALKRGELAALMDACQWDSNPMLGIRNAALIACLYPGGLRRAEVVSLDIADITLEQDGDEPIIKIRVIGKRNKERSIFLNNGAARALVDWLSVRGSEPGALFVGITKGGKLTTRRLTAQAVHKTCQELAQVAGVAKFSAHDFRRSVISDLLDAGVDIATVADIAGHVNIQTTRRYDRRGERARRQAVSKLHLPYRGR